MEHVNFSVNEHFISAFIYDDVSGLDQKDINCIEQFESYVKNSYPSGYWGSPNSEESSNFQTCEVCKLLADCVTLPYYLIPKEDNNG